MDRNRVEGIIGWVMVVACLGLLIFNRFIVLKNFGFQYTDLDQLILWNGLVDYSQGIFHEPFFYGQAYNYMLEALLAVPLYLGGVPVYQALPVVTSTLALLPYVSPGLLLAAKRQFMLAICSLGIVHFFPLEFDILTTISRGFVQAHLFVPLVLLTLMLKSSWKTDLLLFTSVSFSLVANPSSSILVIPVVVYALTQRYNKASFYWSALSALPLLGIHQLVKHQYLENAERIVHNMSGVTLKSETLISSLSSTDLFEFLLPDGVGGQAYLILLSILVAVAFYRKQKGAATFALSLLVVLILSISIPKVMQPYGPIAGAFFTPSRFFLLLPLSIIVAMYLAMKDVKPHWMFSAVLFLIVAGCSFSKPNGSNKEFDELRDVDFPTISVRNLSESTGELYETCQKFDVEVIINRSTGGWKEFYETYAMYPLKTMESGRTPISVYVDADRRNWLYSDMTKHTRFLLNGFQADEIQLDGVVIESTQKDLVIIKLNGSTAPQLLNHLRDNS